METDYRAFEQATAHLPWDGCPLRINAALEDLSDFDKVAYLTVAIQRFWPSYCFEGQANTLHLLRMQAILLSLSSTYQINSDTQEGLDCIIKVLTTAEGGRAVPPLEDIKTAARGVYVLNHAVEYHLKPPKDRFYLVAQYRPAFMLVASDLLRLVPFPQ